MSSMFLFVKFLIFYLFAFDFELNLLYAKVTFFILRQMSFPL